MPIDLIAKKKETQSAEEQYSHEVSSLESSYKEVWQNNNIENVKKIEINKLVPFANHPFTLYEGERLEDMISSIKSNGILMPLIVREKATSYEILSGHNRANAAKLAGLSEVPAIVKRNISDDEAMVYVIVTNVNQRSFTDMLPSEQATVLALQHSKLFSQGKRNDILKELEMLSNQDTLTSSPLGKKLYTIDVVGNEYGLSKNSVARLLRIDKLISPLKTMVDKKEIAIRPAVSLSYLSNDEQADLEMILSENSYKVDMKNAELLRECSKNEKLTYNKIVQILSGKINKKEKSNQPIKIKYDVYSKYFRADEKISEIESVIEKALELYFKGGEEND